MPATITAKKITQSHRKTYIQISSTAYAVDEWIPGPQGSKFVVANIALNPTFKGLLTKETYQVDPVYIYI